MLLPRTCFACGGDVAARTPGPVCAACLASIQPWGGARCRVCDVPLPSGGGLCRDCGHGRAFDRCVSFGVYDGALTTLIHAFKYHGKEHLAKVLSTFMAKAWPEEFHGTDVLVPVPLHWRRRWSRGYNQAELLAKGLSKRTGIRQEGLLRRTRSTGGQALLDRKARLENVADAFAVRRTETVKGKIVCLVDDVCTTGSTLDACARALKDAGALRVNAIVLARQPGEEVPTDAPPPRPGG